MKEIYVAACCRTAIGAFGGSLKDVPVAELGAVVLRETLRRASIEGSAVDEVYLGCVLDAGQGQNVARQASLGAGLPVSVPATTIGMVCGSGMKAVIDGARAIAAGDADVILAGGAENMSQAPYLLPMARWGARMGDAALMDSMIRDGLWDAINDYHMGITAENVARQWQITRKEMDEIALKSQEKAAKAQAMGRFDEEITAVQVKMKKETVSFARDEYLRKTDAESLARLKPAFAEGGNVTAGNASGINDGAAALLLASKDAVEKYNLPVMARLCGWGQAGVDPSIMGVGPVEACRKAVAVAGFSLDSIDLVEANEAFAAQALAVVRELGLSPENVNRNGGAIALGHPIGASGARIIVTLLHEMKKQPAAQRGLATLCIGGGMGLACVFRKAESLESLRESKSV